VQSFEPHSSLRTWREPSLQHSTGTRASFYGAVEDATGHGFTFSSHAQDVDALRRVVSCFIIANLPKEGVQEAFESLRSILDFYATRLPYAPSPAPRLLQGTVVNRSQQPDLVLSSDE
jgi:hypothetical protein